MYEMARKNDSLQGFLQNSGKLSKIAVALFEALKFAHFSRFVKTGPKLKILIKREKIYITKKKENSIFYIKKSFFSLFLLCALIRFS